MPLHLQEKETILIESYARIKHLQSRTWLHLDKGIVSKICSVTDLAFTTLHAIH